MKKIVLLILSVIICASFGLFALGCGEPDQISLSKSRETLEVGDTLDLSQEVTVTNSTEGLTWRSSDEAVATVSGGVVTAVAKGEAIITVSIGEVSASCTVTVQSQRVTFTLGNANGGTITVTENVRVGENATIRVTADQKHEVEQVTLDGAVITLVEGKYTFTTTKSTYEVEATFTGKATEVTVNAGANGSVEEITGKRVGDQVVLEITPDANFEIKSVKLDGVELNAVEGEYSFTVSKTAHLVAVEFIGKGIEVTVNAGANGSVEEITGKRVGDEVVLEITPDANFEIKSVKLDGVELNAVEGEYSFTANKTAYAVVVEFIGKATEVTVNAGANGRVEEITGKRVGDEVVLEITPDANFEIKSVKLDGVELNAVEGEYSFTVSKTAHAVVVEFIGEAVEVTVNAVEHGTVTVQGEKRIGGTVTLTVLPNEGYQIKSVTVDGEPVEVEDGTVTFTATQLVHEIEVEFELKTVTVTVTNFTPDRVTVNIPETVKWFDALEVEFELGDGYIYSKVMVNGEDKLDEIEENNKFVVSSAEIDEYQIVVQAIEDNTVLALGEVGAESFVTKTAVKGVAFTYDTSKKYGNDSGSLKITTDDRIEVMFAQEVHPVTLTGDEYITFALYYETTEGTINNHTMFRRGDWGNGEFEEYAGALVPNEWNEITVPLAGDTNINEWIIVFGAGNGWDNLNAGDALYISSVKVIAKPEKLFDFTENPEKYIKNQEGEFTYEYTTEKAHGDDQGSVMFTPSTYIGFYIKGATNRKLETEMFDLYIYWETESGSEITINHYDSGDYDNRSYYSVAPNKWSRITISTSKLTVDQSLFVIGLDGGWVSFDEGDKVYMSTSFGTSLKTASINPLEVYTPDLLATRGTKLTVVDEFPQDLTTADEKVMRLEYTLDADGAVNPEMFLTSNRIFTGSETIEFYIYWQAGEKCQEYVNDGGELHFAPNWGDENLTTLTPNAWNKISLTVEGCSGFSDGKLTKQILVLRSTNWQWFRGDMIYITTINVVE